LITRIEEEDLNMGMYTNLDRKDPVDILVRTSDVKRFSDFLLWQVTALSLALSDTHINII